MPFGRYVDEIALDLGGRVLFSSIAKQLYGSSTVLIGYLGSYIPDSHRNVRNNFKRIGTNVM